MWSRVPGLVLAAVLASSLAACGDDEPGDDPSSQPSPSAGSTSASASESASESPSVEPATGPVVETSALRMRLFAHKGWNIRPVGTGFGASVSTLDGLFEIYGGGLGTSATDLDRGAEINEKLEAIETPAPKRVENRVVNGVELYVLEGRNERRHTIVVGGYHGGYAVDLDFDIPTDWPDGEALVESMLATIEWK